METFMASEIFFSISYLCSDVISNFCLEFNILITNCMHPNEFLCMCIRFVNFWMIVVLLLKFYMCMWFLYYTCHMFNYFMYHIQWKPDLAYQSVIPYNQLINKLKSQTPSAARTCTEICCIHEIDFEILYASCKFLCVALHFLEIFVCFCWNLWNFIC